MTTRDIVVIGASAGGIETLSGVVRDLPVGWLASVFVVAHFPPGGRSILPEILSRSGPLLATHAVDGESFLPGQIYVAPPDRHLQLAPHGQMRVTRGPRENHHRPAIDPLFRSAARHYGPRVVGVILSGSLYDGAGGLLAVRSAGGVAVVQDPADARVPAMPQNATEIAGADHIVPAAGLAGLLATLVRQPAPEPGVRAVPPPPEPVDPIERMPEAVVRDFDRQVRNEHRGELSTFTCPECGGSLWQVDEAGLIRFRCHVGHAYNGEGLLAGQSEALEAALWTSVRTFKERAVLATQLAAQQRVRGNAAAAGRFDEQAEQSAEYADLILRHVLNSPDTGVPQRNRPT